MYHSPFKVRVRRVEPIPIEDVWTRYPRPTSIEQFEKLMARLDRYLGEEREVPPERRAGAAYLMFCARNPLKVPTDQDAMFSDGWCVLQSRAWYAKVYPENRKAVPALLVACDVRGGIFTLAAGRPHHFPWPPTSENLELATRFPQAFIETLEFEDLAKIRIALARGKGIRDLFSALPSNPWFDAARNDYSASVVSLTAGYDMWYPTWWSCAQCLEKIMKGLMTHKVTEREFKAPQLRHHLPALAARLKVETSLATPEPLVREVDCPPDTRYWTPPTSRDKAYRAYHSLISILAALPPADIDRILDEQEVAASAQSP